MELSLGKRKHEGALALAQAHRLGVRGLDGDEAVQFGVALAGLVDAGADKLTVALSPALWPLADEVTALLSGVGAIPVLDEPIGDAKGYGEDRAFVGARLASEALQAQASGGQKSDDQRLRRLISSGFPVARWTSETLEDERARWQTIAGTAARVRGMDPADAGPQVLPEALLAARDAEGSLPAETAALATGLLALHTTPLLAQMLPKIAGTLGGAASASPAHWVSALLAMADPGDYVVLSLHAPAAEDALLRELHQSLREITRLPVLTFAGAAGLARHRALFLRERNRGIFLQLVAADGLAPEELAAARAWSGALEQAERRVLRLVAKDAVKLSDALREAALLLAK